MRKTLGKTSVIAANIANRHYAEKIKPFADEIKKPEGKETYFSTIMINASADLFHALGDGFEEQLDMLVIIMKEQARKNKK